jgi:hypothetical protein
MDVMTLTSEHLAYIGGGVFIMGILIGYLWGQARIMRRHETVVLNMALKRLKESRW